MTDPSLPHLAPVQIPAPAEPIVDWLYCSVMGLVEGLTEFLPISSTGHLIIVGEGIFGRTDSTFEVGIQIGAITAILVLYRARLWSAARMVFSRAKTGDDTQPTSGRVNLIWLILVAALPASLLGLLLWEHIFDLLFNPTTVAISLVVGGILLWLLEAWEDRRGYDEANAFGMSDMSLRQAVLIGVFQILALIPGTSRSGAMIAGAMVVGCRRTAAAEFSFLVGLPVIYGASCMKLLEQYESFTDQVRNIELLVAALTSFVSALLVVRPFVRFLQNHTFRPFAWYRIAAGSVLLVLVYSGVV